MDRNELKKLFEKAQASTNQAILDASKARIIVDESYCLYLSMFSAYSYIKAEHALEDNYEQDITTIADFRVAFKKKFQSSIFFTAKRVLGANPKMSNVILAGDCAKKNIWRNSIYDKYKLQRRIADKTKNPFDFGKAFNYAKDILIPEFLEDNKGAKLITADNAEGDDVIAAIVRLLPENEHKIVIACDKDYLQLLDRPNLVLTTCQGRVFDLESESKHKVLQKAEHTLTAKEFLLKKILIGDKADNIEPIFERCGEATAYKLILDKSLLKEKLKDPVIYAKFELNQQLIDFDNIPESIIQEVGSALNND